MICIYFFPQRNTEFDSQHWHVTGQWSFINGRWFSLDTPVSSTTNVHDSASIFYKSIAGCYRPVSFSDGPRTARYRFMWNSYWGNANICIIGNDESIKFSELSV